MAEKVKRHIVVQQPSLKFEESVLEATECIRWGNCLIVLRIPESVGEVKQRELSGHQSVKETISKILLSHEEASCAIVGRLIG